MIGSKNTHWFRAIFAGIIIMFIGLDSAIAQQPTTWNDLQGSWISNSAAFGTAAKSTLSVNQTLNDRFFRIQYKINAVSENKISPMFEGVAFYKELEDDQYQAFWADSSGDLHPIVARQEGTSIIADWGTEDVKQGRTRYELRPDASLLITDKILRDGKWVQFNQMEFVKVAESK